MLKYSLAVLSCLVFLLACNSHETNAPESAVESDSLYMDTTARVTGIGGIFFFSNDPEETKKWYAENLGIQMNPWGASFESRNALRPDEINYLQWSLHPNESTYFSPSEKEFMINYRVQNLEKLVEKLKNNGVTIVDTLAIYEYGKFIHIIDEEGNKIELWEPIDSVLTNLGGKTNK